MSLNHTHHSHAHACTSALEASCFARRRGVVYLRIKPACRSPASNGRSIRQAEPVTLDGRKSVLLSNPGQRRIRLRRINLYNSPRGHLKRISRRHMRLRCILPNTEPASGHWHITQAFTLLVNDPSTDISLGCVRCASNLLLLATNVAVSLY